MKREMSIRDNKSVATDGQHKHGFEKVTINIDDSALKLIAKHLPHCIKAPVIQPNTDVPLHFEMNSELTGTATVLCGFCKKPLGTCTVTKVKDAK